MMTSATFWIFLAIVILPNVAAQAQEKTCSELLTSALQSQEDRFNAQLCEIMQAAIKMGQTSSLLEDATEAALQERGVASERSVDSSDRYVMDINKRKHEYLRFGKRKHEYLRFGKRKHEYLRFG
uniref:FMRFamide-like neuropeptides 14 n=1 Tax=Trichuris muris TaxID=70415 RepID=A0A5S6QJ40_TRIMR